MRTPRPVFISNVPGVNLGQLEHIGDRIFWLAASAALLDELRKLNSGRGDAHKRYFLFTQALVTNNNLQSANDGTGSAVEAKVGEVYFLEGLEPAVAAAKEILKRTHVWGKFIQFLEGQTVTFHYSPNCKPAVLIPANNHERHP